MKYSKEDVKLKHLSLVMGEEIDYQEIMSKIFRYKNTWLDRKLLFPFKFRGIYKVIEEIRSQEISKYAIDNVTSLRVPENIDTISYQARLEISTIMETEDLVERMAGIITRACYEKQFNKEFNSDSKLFIEFRERILNKPLLEMLAVYKVILYKVNKSTKMWNELFHKVAVIDPYYESVGGSGILNRFSIPSTVKTMIADYGFSYKEVFMQQYVLVQSNMWEHQCRAYVQDLMTKAKERDMKNKRNQQK